MRNSEQFKLFHTLQQFKYYINYSILKFKFMKTWKFLISLKQHYKKHSKSLKPNQIVKILLESKSWKMFSLIFRSSCIINFYDFKFISWIRKIISILKNYWWIQNVVNFVRRGNDLELQQVDFKFVLLYKWIKINFVSSFSDLHVYAKLPFQFDYFISFFRFGFIWVLRSSFAHQS